MSFGPTYLPELEDVVQQGRGIAASVLGQQFAVSRRATDGDMFYSTTPTLTGFQAYVKRASSRSITENVTFDLLVAIATCDVSLLQLGDLLTTINADGMPESWIFAQHRPMRETIFVRVESLATVRRNSRGPGSLANQPTSGSIAAGYAGRANATDTRLTLQNGTTSFAGIGEPLAVPCGLQPQNRSRGAHQSELPSSTEESRFCAYLPPLGVAIAENDEIQIGGDVYIVRQAFTTVVGFVGNILIVEKQNM